MLILNIDVSMIFCKEMRGCNMISPLWRVTLRKDIGIYILRIISTFRAKSLTNDSKHTII